ncbi:penicillin acylase family protein [Flavitalea sp. BT771]|uniref:penicillin acylase family protein n=1 Tax=Flavitalea sp. BT771 TaxID=3063329 RepID=UPI0026E2C6F2|nr:penicillin acylase family protein [Flavitalea sp. BT771]MDO6434623.1 penicillin acylase family protein [Flavitalea sp. BT771]MDV6223523.1 penicillin acylase family protein [Flavitalea sp. BT771]
MKYFRVILLTLMTAAWVYLTSVHYSGLNSIQGIANYHDGMLSLNAPRSAGHKVIKGQGKDAEVFVDTLGIPHIFAGDLQGLAYATGFMHARDRYFQMELIANTVMGRLSTILGEAGIGSDRYWIRFELENRAQEYLDSIHDKAPDLYHYLVAYSDGVNACINAESARERDPMYKIWNYSPGPWKPYYIFLVQSYMSSELALYDDYFNRQEILDKLPDAIRQMLYPTQPADQPTIIPSGHSAGHNLAYTGSPAPEASGGPQITLFKPGEKNNYIPREFNRSLGSNNWVVDSSHTASGELLLCNDLHLFLTSPDIFYELHLSCARLHAYGFSIPGVPFILTGHNDKIAWGITNGGWDVTEQYLLKVDPKSHDNYWLDGQWKAMTKKDFVIAVKDRPSQKLTVRYTVFGQVVEKDTFTFSLRWHPLYSCNAVASFWRLMQASCWEEFGSALRYYDYPSQNFAYADVHGNIGMICAGKMPVKPEGYAGGVLDGTRSPIDRYIPFDSLPHSFHPGTGYLFSANQQPENGKYYYSSRWFDDLYRPRRIAGLLSEDKKVGREKFLKMQSDTKDLSAADIAALLKLYFPDTMLSPEWEKMRNWDGVLDPGNQEAIFYKVFRRSAKIEGEELARSLGVRSSPGYDQLMHFLAGDMTLSYDSVTISSSRCFKHIVKMTDSLYARYKGEKGFKPFDFHIPQMTLLPGLDIDVNDLGGSDNTINVNYGAHPVIRTLIQIKNDTISSWMINAIGQTGRINDRQYYQQLADWKKNSPHPTQFTANPRELKYIRENILFEHK